MMSNNESELSSNPSQDAISLTHVNEKGCAQMVDVGGKPISVRTATAISRIEMTKMAAEAIRSNDNSKGDALQVARIAAIQSSKWTSHMIPLCHSVPIDSVQLSHEWKSETVLQWNISVKSTGTTGVEMEALHAASIAALTVYDMCKAIDSSMTIREIFLVKKTGGTRGEYTRKESNS